MLKRKCGEKEVCIEGICFTSLYDAGKFLNILAERRQRVRITQRRNMSACSIVDHLHE